MTTTTRQAGFTMIEVLIAAAITAIIAGGALAAYVASSRMMGQQNSPTSAEAADFAQQTMERYRNMIACDSTWFNASANCAAASACPPTCAAGVWMNDALPSSAAELAAAGSESMLNHVPAPKRCYHVERLAGCSGSGPDCFTVNVKVCWGDYTAAECPCP